MELSAELRSLYREDGFVLLSECFTEAECDQFIAHVTACKDAQLSSSRGGRSEGRGAELSMAVHSKLRLPVRGCLEEDGWGPGGAAEPDLVQAMYFWQGSEQERHQDGYYLPECLAAWIALEDVSPTNGTVWVQRGSHKRRLLVHSDFASGGDFCGVDYNEAVNRVFEQNAGAGLREEPIIAKKGDVLVFSGGIIHRGGPIADPSASRHVYATHYVASEFTGERLDRRGAGSAQQYDSPGGLGRFALSRSYPHLQFPTSLYFGVLPDGSGRAFLRREDGKIQAGVNGQDGINGDDLKQFVKRIGEDPTTVVDVGRLTTRL
eukprot:COSAG02_NODE_453_length_22025_cov_16.179923_8_plen_320_part_00